MKQGWEIKKLGEVCTFCSGYTPKENEFKKCATIPVPYFKVSDMNHLENHKYLTYTTLYLENGCKTYPKHTIVFPKNGAAIATNKKRLLGQDSVVDLNTGGVIANDKIVFYEYLYLFLLNLDFRLFTRRGAVPTLDIAELKKQTIPVPPLPVQEQIVSELDLLSGIIEKKREQLKELDALAQSIFYDMFGDPITNEKGWEVKKLGEVAPIQEYKGNIPNVGGNYWLLNLDMIEPNSGEILDKCYYSIEEIGNSTITFNTDNVLYSKLRPYLNKVVIPNDIGYATSELLPLYPKKEKLNRVFFGALLRSSSFVKHISIKVAGAKMPRVSTNELKSFNVILPPLPLQHQFATKTEAIEKQKELIKQSISETETLFNERMQHYFS